MKKIICLLSIVFLFHDIQAQYVSTIFNYSNMQVDDAITQDKWGNIYGSHYMGSRVYKITPSGNVSIFTTGLNTPNGLAFNSQNQLYVVDNIGNRIYKLDSTGNRLDTIVLSSPSGIIKSLDSDTMILTQYAGHAIRKLAPDGVVSAPIVAGSPLNGPVGLCYGVDSNLYIGNFTGRQIFKLISGQLIRVATIPGPSNSSLGFIAQANGFIYGTTFQSDKIYKVDPNFTDSVILFSGSTGGNADGHISVAKFNDPNGIHASSGGDSLLISDFTTGNIRLISGLVTGDIQEKWIRLESRVYPNPSRDFVKIEANIRIEEIQIYSLEGKLIVAVDAIDNTNYTLNHKLRDGVYFLKIKTEEGYVNQKLIVAASVGY